jgi:hypothetical protein
VKAVLLLDYAAGRLLVQAYAALPGCSSLQPMAVPGVRMDGFGFPA